MVNVGVILSKIMPLNNVIYGKVWIQLIKDGARGRDVS